MELKRVVVTGIGTLNGGGNNIQEYWETLSKGISACDLIPYFDTTHFKTKFACVLKGYDPLNHFDRKESRKLDRFAQYAMVATEEAMKDANLDLDKLDLDKAGVIFGSGIGGLGTFEEELEKFFEGGSTPRFNPFFIPKMIADIAAGHISMRYSFRGPNFATVSACASASHAIIDAFNYLRLGKANLFITGGAEAPVTRAGLGGFNSMHALSTNNENYKTASRPFCKTRDGFVMGEGCGTLILEELSHAKARGAKIYAEMMGGGMTADAHHLTAPHPEGLGASNVMKYALEDANMRPEEIDYINVHGTATPLGDISETLAIKKIFGDHAYKLNISSTKSLIGHLLGAAGAVEAIASILAMQHNLVPPTINHHELDPDLDNDLNFTLHKAQERPVNAVLSNTFGFGGHNASVVFKRYDG